MTDAATIDNAQQPQGGSEDAQSTEPQKSGRSPCLCPVFSAHAGMIPHVRDC